MDALRCYNSCWVIKYTSRLSDIGVIATILASFSVYWLKQLWKREGKEQGARIFNKVFQGFRLSLLLLQLTN